MAEEEKEELAYEKHTGGENDYLYLYLEHAKVRAFGKKSTQQLVRRRMQDFNINSNFTKSVQQNYQKSWGQLPQYMQNRNTKFENWVSRAMNKTSYSTGNLGAAQISPAVSVGGFSGLASNIHSIRTKADLLKQAVIQLNDIIDNLEQIDDQINQHILSLALQNPQIKESLNLSIPDGIYQANSNFNINHSLQKGLDTARQKCQEITSKLSVIAPKGNEILSEDDGTALGYILLTIQMIISANRGFLFEAETLDAFLQTAEQGTEQIVYTGHMSNSNMKIINDPQEETDLKIVKNLREELKSVLSSIQVQNPKADLMCGVSEKGVVSIFGLSIKSASDNRYQGILNGKGAKSISISLGSTERSLKEIMSTNSAALSEFTGGINPSWYGAQILTGLSQEYPGKPPKSISEEPGGGEFTQTWNNILNACSILALTDALVGIGKKTIGQGYATYLVVNNLVYWMGDVLNKVVLALEQNKNPGVYGFLENSINRKWGQQLQKSSFVKLRGNMTVRNAALERSLRIWNQWDATVARQMLKISISLGALTSLANSAGLTPIN